MERLLLIAAISSIGYVLLPLAGAFRVRRHWRRFRSSIYRSMAMPILTYRIVRRGGCSGAGFRFFGRIEASQGESRLWLTDGRLSLQVDLDGVALFTLPGLDAFDEEGRVENNERAFTDAAPAHIQSRRVAALPQGTEIMVAGTLSMENDRPVFMHASDRPLLVLIYDGEPETILRRAIWSGRQRNEYWNRVTPLSLTLASFSLFILAYLYLRTPAFLPFAHIALTVSLLPLAPLLPPGLALFALYRRIWREGRFLRAERDLISLPALRFPPGVELAHAAETALPDGSAYRVEIFSDCEGALESCGGGKIRTSRALIDRDFHGRRFYVFGCAEGEPAFRRDPFAETVLIPGDPRSLSTQCGRGARRREYAAACCFLLALGLNSAIIFALLWAVLI